MKQVIQNLRSGETRVVDAPIPGTQPGMALVKTATSLVSAGTERMLVSFAEKSLVGKARSRPDLVRQVLDKARREGLVTAVEAAYNRLDQPLALGYASAGTIVALGPGVQGYQVGQRVACAGGGYAVHAEYAVVPQNLLAALPDQVDFEAAAFTTLGAIALHGFRLAQPQLGERLAIIGLGLLGLLTVGIATAAGCHVLGVDLDPARVKLAQTLGAIAVLRPEAEAAALAFSRGQGCDGVLICADTDSPDPVELAGNLARDRARVVAVGAVGLQLPRKIYYEKELSFINSRSYGPGRYDPSYEEGGQDYPLGYVRWTEGRNLAAFVDLLAGGQLDVAPLISHRFPIEQAPQAYELITGKTKAPFLGVLLTYPESTSSGSPADESPKLVSTGVQPVHPAPVNISAKTGMVNLGVLGAGNFATAVMLPVLKKVSAVKLVAIASGRGLNAQQAANKFGFSYATSDPEKIFMDDQVNTIAILTRHHLHADQVIAGLQAGKHVFCEKPLAISLEQLESIQAEVEGQFRQAATSLLMVGFNRRFAPLSQQMAEFFKGRHEPLVANYRVNAGYIPLSHWVHDPQQGGGRIIGEGCHFIDFLTFLVGEPPVTISARSIPASGRYQDDVAVLTFTFPDSSIGTLSYLANGDKAFSKERVEVFCGGRVAVLDDFRSLVLVSDGSRHTVRSRWHQDKGHMAEWNVFSAAIVQGSLPPIPYNQLFGVTRATIIAQEALHSGETISIG